MYNQDSVKMWIENDRNTAGFDCHKYHKYNPDGIVSIQKHHIFCSAIEMDKKPTLWPLPWIIKSQGENHIEIELLLIHWYSVIHDHENPHIKT